MSKLKYVKKPGDFEIRILTDGRLVLVGPDDEILSIANTFIAVENSQDNTSGMKKNGRAKPETDTPED
ncbi:MAG: hypothetical protein JXB29_02155 [Sedimentisphaerales bacterium]|nr:hypothetical protein [Sedimentisphaerales bacterium]